MKALLLKEVKEDEIDVSDEKEDCESIETWLFEGDNGDL